MSERPSEIYRTLCQPIAIPESEKLEVPKCASEIESSFVKSFNEDPLGTFQRSIDDNLFDVLSNDYTLSRLLFYNNSIKISAITKLILSRAPDRKSLLFFYFSSFNLDYCDLSKAASIALSRIEFPNDKDQIQFIIQTFSETYLSHNSYLGINADDVFYLTRASILFSLRTADYQEMPKNEFLDILNTNGVLSLYQNSADKADFIESYYEILRKNVIPIFFTFMETRKTRNTHLEGKLIKVNSIANKDPKYFELTETELRYYKPKKFNQSSGPAEQQGYFLLENVEAQFTPDPKNPHKITIKRKDNKPFGYTINKNKNEIEPKHRTSLMICCNNEQEMNDWITSINYNSFLISLKQVEPQK